MGMNRFIKAMDIVEVLDNPYFPLLAGDIGQVCQVVGDKFLLVDFDCPIISVDKETGEKFVCTKYLIAWNFLKVIDSPSDDRLGSLEDKIEELEDDLSFARSCLQYSEEAREAQEDVAEAQRNIISHLIEEIDKLKKELYDARGF